ncbi:hypothetical protein COJ36_02795 [Priestia megaterium]|uniref:hypothetical protein n=1 Tax=Priestia megaterium TaxID=1404 RepID=UPI000BF93CED|nr:hypothetical protein [Priestia megaterium]PFL70500.1 hypothetical protein COJ36_02795 [Priestia megaterium]
MPKTAPVLIFSNNDYPELMKFKIYEGCYFLSSGEAVHIQVKNADYLIDSSGSGVYRSQFIMNPSDWVAALEEAGHHISGDFIGRDMRGSLCGFISNKSAQESMIIPDPFGSAIVFYYRSRSITVFSTDIDSIVSVLSSVGISLQKSMDYLNEVIGTGNGGFFESSYEEIQALKPFEYVTSTNNSFSINEYSWKQDFFSSDKSYEEQLTLAVEEIKNNIQAVSNYKHVAHKISHLTGGFDSRLVLAGILGTDSGQSYRFFCSGRPNMPDRYTAERLCSEFGLTMTEYNGFNALKAPQTLEERFLWPLDFSSGILAASPHRFYETNSNIVLSGGYGECFRSFFGSRAELEQIHDVDSLMPTLWGKIFFDKDKDNALLSEKFKKRFSQKIKHFFNDCRENGLREDAYLDYMYLVIRNRYYVGVTSHRWSSFGARFDPLYTLNGIKCALSVSQEMRSANVVGIDLMNRLFSDLSTLPFDREIYTETYSKLRGNVTMREFKSERRPKFALSEMVKPVEGMKAPKALPEHIERAKKLRAPLWQVVELGSVQEKCLEYLSTMETREIDAMFNRKILFRLLRSPNLSSRVHIRKVFSVYSILLWYFAEKETLQPIV